MTEAVAADTQREVTSWGFAEGDEISPGRTALRRLGGGRRYDAYLGWDDHMHSVVVFKVVRPHLAEDARVLRGLREEWETIERLTHPVIVRGFDAELEGPRPHLVLEHLEGPRLSSLVRKYGPLPAEQLVPLGIQLSSAVHYLGQEGIVHLDIKPSNAIMGAPPRLIDLSVALPVDAAGDLRSHVGTDAYMSPEQCDPEGLGPVGPAADVWGLGVTLYKAATGALPYPEPGDEGSMPDERWPQLVEEPEPISGMIPSEVAEAIMDCLRYEPSERPSPAELSTRLEPVLGGLPKPRLRKSKPRL
jgi:eukaryotic-like serine/threonine-protein kinase